MKVFLSWSGPRSRHLADALRTWMPRVIQSLRPWMSDEDISAGSRWLPEISKELNDAKVGILCVTPENQTNPWLIFEAGALSKTLDQPFVCPLLFDMTPGQMQGPLTQFQALQFDRAGILRILSNLNNVPGHASLPTADLEEIFDVWWPKLEARLLETPPSESSTVPKRSPEELMEEILNISREQIRRENLRLEHSRLRDAKIDRVIPIMEQMTMHAEQMRDQGKSLGNLLSQLPLPPELAQFLPLFETNAPPSTLADMVQTLKELSVASHVERQELLNTPEDNQSPPNPPNS